MRKDLEKLAVWWIPAVILASILGGGASAYFANISEAITLNAQESKSFLATFYSGKTAIIIVLKNLDHFVVAAWLYLVVKRNSLSRPVLWALLGYFSGLVGVLLHVGLAIYESKNSEPNTA